MKTVYFVRHGQSEGNVANEFQSYESPLNENGKNQAEQVAQRVSKLGFDALIVSPQMRAKQTAEAIHNITNHEPIYSDFFIERRKPSNVDGEPYDNEVASEVYSKWLESNFAPEIKVEDGENYDDLINRAQKALEFLENRDEATIVVVSTAFLSEP